MEPEQPWAMHCVPVAYSWQAPLPSQKPLVPQLAAPASVHWFSGSEPAGTTLQVPTEPVSAHDRQVPVHAVWQHTPCEQLPELQSVLAVHMAPLDSSPQVMFMHVAGEVQSALTVHVVLHTPPVAAQANGVHSDGVTVLHVPAPSQVRVAVKVEPTQVEAAQVVPLAYSWQAPFPSQRPFVPQLEAPMLVHWLVGFGLPPAGTLMHVPGVSAHDMQVPVQLELQHTPCWQNPDAHSVRLAQARPSGFFVHVPPLQTLGATQSASTVQLTLHTLLVVSQTKAPHDDVLAARHIPLPSQVRAAVNVDPVQLLGVHCVLLT